MATLDQPDGARARSHRQRLGHNAVALESHAPQQGPSVTPVAAKNTLSPETRSVVVSVRSKSKPASRIAVRSLVIPGNQPAEHLPTQAAERARGQHALGRPADAHQQIDARSRAWRP